MNAAKTATSGAKGGRAHAPVAGLQKAKVRCEYRDLKQDRMAVVTEAPGQGDELAVVNRQDRETATATANVVLDDNIAALGDRSWGARVGLSSHEGRVYRTHSVCYISLDVRSTLLTFNGQGAMRPECPVDARA